MKNDKLIKAALVNHMSGFITEQRKDLFEEIILQRTRYITVVLEDIFQPHNASAVLRTCDCFGIQDVHIIENKNIYDVNPDVALGASKWLSLFKYNEKENNTVSTLKGLKKRGYKILATTPHQNDVMLEEVCLDDKIALVFGTELNGLSKEAINHADGYVKIPMVGFTESFNISVSAAIILHQLTEKIKKSNLNWKLNEDEKVDIKLGWMRNSIKRSELIEEEFLKFS